MSPAKNTLIILFLVFIFMDILLTSAGQSSCSSEVICNEQNQSICDEKFSSLTCQITFTDTKRCTVEVCINHTKKAFEKKVDLTIYNLNRVSFLFKDKEDKQRCYSSCCLKENLTKEYLCYNNKCQFKVIYIFQRRQFNMNDASENICLSGNQAAIEETLDKKPLDKQLMKVDLLDEVQFTKDIPIKQNGMPCQEEEFWQILDSNRKNWKSYFDKNITNCLLKSKDNISEDFILVLKKTNETMDIWHFLVVKLDLSISKQNDTINNRTTVEEGNNFDNFRNGTFNKKHNIKKLIHLVENLTETVMEKKNKIEIVSDILNNLTDKDSLIGWRKLKNEKSIYPTRVMKIVESFLENIVNTTNSSKPFTIDKENIAIQFEELKNNTISVNLDSDESLTVHVADSVINNMSSDKDDQVFYSVVLYKSLTYLIQMTETNGTHKRANHQDLLSNILSFTIHKEGIKTPIKNITFQLNHKKLTLNSKCAYWSSNTTDSIGEWKTDGCFRTSWNESYTECVCNHLTNFALLMSPHKTVKSFTMDLVSMIGGMISILAVFLTVICYIILWRHVTTTTLNKSRAIILMNLCASMFIANLLFLISDYLKSYKITCKVISVLLHFFYLTMFFTMLMEGIDIFITIVFVFSKIDVKKLILAAWGLPAIIVAISAGVTQFDGYGELEHCWLSQKRGLNWAFMGPAFFIIVTNLIITLVVLKNMLKNSEMLQKPVLERAKAGMWGLILFSPILGFTWGFSVFLIHKSVVVQYIFSVFHSLQGILIFLLHCVFSKQIKDGFFQYMKKIKNKSNITNSAFRSAAFDKTQNPTLTTNTNRSVDNLSLPYPQTLTIFQSRKSQDFLVPKNGVW